MQAEHGGRTCRSQEAEREMIWWGVLGMDYICGGVNIIINGQANTTFGTNGMADEILCPYSNCFRVYSMVLAL